MPTPPRGNLSFGKNMAGRQVTASARGTRDGPSAPGAAQPRAPPALPALGADWTSAVVQSTRSTRALRRAPEEPELGGGGRAWGCVLQAACLAPAGAVCRWALGARARAAGQPARHPSRGGGFRRAGPAWPGTGRGGRLDRRFVSVRPKGRKSGPHTEPGPAPLRPFCPAPRLVHGAHLLRPPRNGGGWGHLCAPPGDRCQGRGRALAAVWTAVWTDQGTFWGGEGGPGPHLPASKQLATGV